MANSFSKKPSKISQFLGGEDGIDAQEGMDLAETGLGIAGDITGAVVADKYHKGQATGKAIGGTVGTVAGMALGGPVGAKIGGALLGTVGSLIGGGADRRKMIAEQSERTRKGVQGIDLTANVNPYGQFEEGGMVQNDMMGAQYGMPEEQPEMQQPQSRTINIERGELLSDTHGNILQKFTNPNRFSPHADSQFKEPNGNFIDAPNDAVVIPKHLAKRFEKGDTLTRKSIMRKLIDQQVQDPHINDPKGATGQYAEGGFTGTDPNRTAAAVYKTQQEVDAANQFARDFEQRRYGHVKNKLIDSQDVYVARQPGDSVVRFEDAASGKDITGQPAPTRKLLTRLPSGISPRDVKSYDGEYWYDDPHTGDAVFVAPNVVVGQYGEGGYTGGVEDPTKLKSSFGAGKTYNPITTLLKPEDTPVSEKLPFLPDPLFDKAFGFGENNIRIDQTPGTPTKPGTVMPVVSGAKWRQPTDAEADGLAILPTPKTGATSGRPVSNTELYLNSERAGYEQSNSAESMDLTVPDDSTAPKGKLDWGMVGRRIGSKIPALYQMVNAMHGDPNLREEYNSGFDRARANIMQMDDNYNVNDQMAAIDQNTAAGLQAIGQNNTPSSRAEAAAIVAKANEAKGQVQTQRANYRRGVHNNMLSQLANLDVQQGGSRQGENIRVQTERRMNMANDENIVANALSENYRMDAGWQNDMEKIKMLNEMSKYENINPLEVARFSEDPKARERIFADITSGTARSLKEALERETLRQQQSRSKSTAKKNTTTKSKS